VSCCFTIIYVDGRCFHNIPWLSDISRKRSVCYLMDLFRHAYLAITAGRRSFSFASHQSIFDHKHPLLSKDRTNHPRHLIKLTDVHVIANTSPSDERSTGADPRSRWCRQWRSMRMASRRGQPLRRVPLRAASTKRKPQNPQRYAPRSAYISNEND